MLDEIRQQPEALERTLRGELRGAEQLRKLLERHRRKLIILAARGTSDNAAQFGRYLLEITTRIPTCLAAPSVSTLYQSEIDYSGALVVAISQSGESTDTNVVLQNARRAGAMTVGITNESESSMANLAEHLFLVRAGKEKSVAATKTYTGQLLSMYMLAWALGAGLELDELRALPELAATTWKLEPQIADLAGRYRFMDHCVVIGRGLNYSNTFEFALKLMETCYVVAERFSSADLQHGPIAMMEQSFPAFVFAPPGVTWPGIRDLLVKLDGLKADTLVITDQGHKPAIEVSKRRIVTPLKRTRKARAIEDLYTPIPYIIPAQLFAAKLAAEKGNDPDQPRTLQKVTRTL